MDEYLNMQLSIFRNDSEAPLSATVKKRALDLEHRLIGKAHKNPHLDTRRYEVEFVDGHSEILSTNIIAENLFYQVDEEGYHQKMLLEISDHRVLKDAISKDKGTFYTDRGLERKVRTTKGWELYVTWKDGPGDWISLKDLKNCYPLEVVDYAMAKEIQDELAFAWWIPWTLKKRTHIISMVKTKYWDKTHKFGIKVPKSITEAKRIDLDNKNKLWTEAVRQEIINVRVTLKKI